MTVLEMREKRATMAAAAKAILDGADVAKRALTAEEASTFDNLMREINGLRETITRRESSDALGRELSAPANPERRSGIELGAHEAPERDTTGAIVLAKDQRAVDVLGRGADNETRGLSVGGFIRAFLTSKPRNSAEERALGEATVGAGGAMVPTYLLGQFIDRLRAKTVTIQAGATTVLLDSNKSTIARLTGDPTAAWRAESATISPSDPTFDLVTFTANSLSCLVTVSRELLADAVNGNQAIMNAITRAMALELDRAALFGSGSSNQPTGVFNASGIGSVSLGTNGAALANYDSLVDASAALWTANAEGPTAFITSPRVLGSISKLKDTTNRPLPMPDAIKNIPVLATSSVPINQVQGSSGSVCSCILAGNWSELLIGLREQLTITPLVERYADTGNVGFIAHVRADVVPAHAASFSRVIGIL